MVKRDIVNQIANRVKVNYEETSEFMEAFIKVMNDAIAKGNNVYIRGLATFSIKTMKEKKARHIFNNQEIIIPPRKKIVVKIHSKLQQKVQRLPVEPKVK